ncbi:hypothetical protein HYH03_007682 [Edaphochlamys debaryana]|uniref:G-patch domain-containing protein n=1 Tax=Edaphochlamys debaryana TaxID=47281 RepID=A0A836BYN6_9CHLO|nr:hypothetical protein HYH03_007682 [Edaphochlamys debaryana]|eukprot:KAG2494036.1 hypothetical protein HYH03_007682 [Edaphochlamys debaryana]
MARVEPAGGSNRPIPGFRSSGVHVLDAYISTSAGASSSGRSPPPSAPQHPPPAHAAAQQSLPNSRHQGADSKREHPSSVPGRGGLGLGSSVSDLDPGDGAGPSGSGSRSRSASGSTLWSGHIPADNVGFRLLRKAGWAVGTGLGAAEQGRTDPLLPDHNKGNRGVGFDSAAAQEASRRKQEAQAQEAQAQRLAGRKRAAEERANGPAARMAALVKGELAAESLDDKVRLHTEQMRAEAEQKRGRAIERYLRAAFNDPFDAVHSDNSNVLRRRNALTESNPLLDPIGD